MQITRQNIQRLSSNNFYTVPTPLNGLYKEKCIPNTYLIQKQPFAHILQIRCSWNLCKIHRKIPLLESLVKRHHDLKFIKKRIQHMYFPVNFEKFSRKTLFTNHLRMTTCLIPPFQPTFYVFITLFSFSLHFFRLLVIIAVIRIYSVCYLFQ